MKLKKRKFPLNEFLNKIKIFELIIQWLLDLFLFSIRKTNKLFSPKDGNIVIISLHKLGDTLFTIPAITELKKQYHQKKCIIICFSSSVPIYNLAFNDVEYFIVSKKDFWFQERIAKNNIKKKLKYLNPYTIFDLTGWIISASLIFNSRAREIIGINHKHFRAIYDKYIQPRTNPRLIDIYLDAILPVIRTPDMMYSNFENIKISPGGIVLLHPFAGWEEKEWNFKKFLDLAVKLNERFRIGLLVPPNHVSYDIRQEINNLNIPLIETISSEELIKSIKNCAFFIGNDSGPINIANYLGKPTLTIFGSTNPDYTASKLNYQKHTQIKLNCSARDNEKYCLIGADTFYCPGTQCMNLLSSDNVYKTVLPMIKNYCQMKN